MEEGHVRKNLWFDLVLIGSNYLDWVLMGSRRQAVFSISGMMFQIPLKLETARWWFGPVALLFARYSPLRGCSSQTPSHRVKLLRDQLPPSTLIGTREF
jgi:hypothetical protein